MILTESSLYVVALILASVSGLIAIGVLLPRRRAHGAGALILLLFGLSFWSLAYAFHWASDDPQWRYFWLNVTYLGVVIVPGAMFVFTCRYTGKDNWITNQKLALFFIEPVAVVLLVWTDLQHGWFFAGKRALTDSVLFDGSPLFWIHVLYSYGMMLVATVILFNYAMRSLRFYQWQISIFVGGLLLPWGVNIISIMKLSPFPDLDLTPIAFTFTGVIMLYNMLNHRLLDILPIARDLLIENIDEGVLVLDNNNRLVDYNLSAQSLFSNTHKLKVGELIIPLLTRWPALIERYMAVEQLDTEIVLDEDGTPSYFDLRVQPIRDKRGALQGRLIIWRNITIRKQAELALQNANEQLQSRIGEVEDLQEQLREQAIRDGLTGTYNRRYLDDALEREFHHAQRENKPLTIAIIDLDSFKSINDDFGHRAGDVTLQKVAAFMKTDTRASDIVCRYGGEEFVIVMPGADAETAVLRAESWRQSIERLVVDSPRGQIHVTVSIGIAAYPMHAKSVEDLLHAADDALYAAKRNGKNRLVVYGS